jgi:hypothetical protein
MGEYQLPETDDDIVAQFQSEYNAAFSSGTSEELYNARTRQVHQTLMLQLLWSKCVGVLPYSSSVTFLTCPWALASSTHLTIALCLQIDLGDGALVKHQAHRAGLESCHYYNRPFRA